MKKYLYKIRLILAIVVLILSAAGILGLFYPFKIFDFQIIPFIQRLAVDFSIAALTAALIVTVGTLIFGRLYCSLCCPLGIAQELVSLISKKDFERRKSYPFKYFIAAVSIGCLIGGTTIIVRYIEPYTLFSSAVTGTFIPITLILAVFLIAFFFGRFFCTNICPAGTILGLLSKFSAFKMYIDKQECLSCGMCERNCQSGCIDLEEQEIDNETCVKCFKCLDKCPKEAVKYGFKPVPDVKFNKKRRKLIITAGVLAFAGAAMKAGIDISKYVSEKIRMYILPPFSGTGGRLLNKCLNCNLCVLACPNKIIKKADKNFGAVHIEYGEKGFCDYECIECSKVCPSGALKRISLEEKQNLRIAMAQIDKQNCIKCGKCVKVCPKNAISFDKDGYAITDAQKCIGCGICKAHCNFNAINIYGIKEQKII